MQHPHQHSFSTVEALANGNVNPIDISNGSANFLSEDHSVSSVDQDDEMGNFHVPHGLCRTHFLFFLIFSFFTS